ncbi:1-acyl-sn-glycerol-3-phosphate acyltransferase [Photobacterium swingsii]|uniref:1-acyl-sn-glycerol-3-phosphate acyltransferase n=1 Tax=Photobacterium swingsii TaxID=680026 RepID=UPI0040695788
MAASSTMKTEMNRYWRIFATGFCFSLFGVGALALTFLVFPVMTLSARNQQQREMRVQAIIQRTFAFFCRTMKFTGAIDYEFIGEDILRQDRNCLVVANHPSLIDYVLIASCMPQCDCLVKAALWNNPFIKGIVKAAGYIPNRDPDNLISDCSERLKDGNVLLIFPEGTRTTPKQESKLQRGAAQIAIRTQSDIRLIHITVSPSFLTKESKWYNVPKNKPFFRVEVKDKIHTARFIDEADSVTTAARHLNSHLAEVLFPPSAT